VDKLTIDRQAVIRMLNETKAWRLKYKLDGHPIDALACSIRIKAIEDVMTLGEKGGKETQEKKQREPEKPE